jgi:hypothetical protein
MKLNFRCIQHPGLPTIALGMREIEVFLGFESIFYSFISELGMAEFGDKGVFTFNMKGNTWTIQHVLSIYIYTELIFDCGINGERDKMDRKLQFCCIILDVLQLLIVLHQPHTSCHTSPKRVVLYESQTSGAKFPRG